MQGGTKTVGGGAASPTADAWSQFLGQGLQTGTFGAAAPGTGIGQQNSPGQQQNQGNAADRMAAARLNAERANRGLPPINQQAPQQYPMMGQNSPFAGAINTQLGGGITPNMPNAPGFVNPQLDRLNPNLDLSQYNFNMGQAGLPGFSDAMRMFSGMGGSARAGTSATGVPDFMNTGNQNFNLGLPGVDMNDPQFAAAQQLLDRQNQVDLANMRARYSVGGGAGYSTGALRNEADLRNQMNASNVMTMGQLSNSLRDQNRQDAGTLLNQATAGSQDVLARLGLSSQSQLGNRGISSNESIANANNAMQGMGMQQQGFGQLLNYALGLGNLGLNAAGQNANNAYNQFGANNNAMQTNNQNQLGAAGMQNTFNTNQFGQQSQNAMGMAGMQNQNIQQILNQLFGAFGQTQGLGTPQAQTVQTPSPFSQIAGAAGALLPMFAPGAFNPFAMLGGMAGNGMSSQGMNNSPQGLGSNWQNPYAGNQGINPVPMTGMVNQMGGAGGNMGNLTMMAPANQTQDINRFLPTDFGRPGGAMDINKFLPTDFGRTPGGTLDINKFLPVNPPANYPMNPSMMPIHGWG